MMKHVSLLFALGWSVACGPTLHASIKQDRFGHDRYDYEVTSATPGTFKPAPEGWKLDNLNYRGGRLTSKSGSSYEVRYFIDVDNDGKSDDLGKEFAYDLRFVSKKDAGVMWLRTLPLHPDDDERELRVLAERYVAGVSGTHYEIAQLEGELYRTQREQRFATSIVERTAGRIASQEAYAVTVDIADVDQLQLDRNARRNRVTIVLVRTPFVRKGSTRRGLRDLPVLMLIGYANLVEDFERSLPAFDDLLRRIVIQGHSGLALRVVSDPPPTESSNQAVAEAEAPREQIQDDLTAPHAAPEDDAPLDQPAP